MYDFVFCRSTSKSNTNAKISTTTTKNRFEPLQMLEVSSKHPPDVSGGENVGTSTLMRPKIKNGKSHTKTAKSVNNPNPTGDIWDQKSLNLDTLFNVTSGNKFKVGIWNAESVRQKENLIKQYILENDLIIFIVLESWLHLDELPYTIDVLPCIEGYKLHQLPRPDRKNSSGGGMLCIYKSNIEIKKIPVFSTKILEVMDLRLSTNSKTISISLSST